jgi:NADH dehydrogenase
MNYVPSHPTRIVILGGGFGGLYAAIELEKRLAGRDDVEITLINRENFFLFTPMLHEVAAGDLDLATIVNPVRKLLRRTQFFCGEVHSIDLRRHMLTVSHGAEAHMHTLGFDHLVIGLGSVPNFHGLPGLEENALAMKTLGDAIDLRNRALACLEEADFECCASQRERLLTFVVAGGGFAGIETAASLNDFLHEAIEFYRNLKPEMIRVVVAHSGKVILPELREKLGLYAQRRLQEKNIDVRTEVRLVKYENGVAHFSDGSAVQSNTIVWTAGTSPNPLLEQLPCVRERGRVAVNEFLQVPEFPGVWALGDCAFVLDQHTGKPHPPTAQHALRQGRTLARNIVAAIDGKPMRAFSFRTLGQLASLGRRCGVANILGVNFSGFIAWWLWRTIYLAKLPGLEKKIRVALDWTLDLFFSKDLVQFKNSRAVTVSNQQQAVVAAA